MSESVKIGILGAGEMARKHAESLALAESAEAAGVSGAGAESLARMEKDFGVPVYADREELFRNCDAVDICLPTFLHEEATLAAAAAGLHVICEKPMAMTVDEAENMIRACGDAGVHLMIAHCLRFWPEYVFLKESVDSGEHGRILNLSCVRFGGFPDWASRGWLMDAEKSGGPAVDLHIHDVDMIAWVAGMPSGVRARETKSENIWSVFSEFEFNAGFTARAEAGWYLKSGYEFRQGYRAVFENAVIEFDSSKKGNPLSVFRQGAEPEFPALPRESAYVRQLKYFAECVRAGRAPERSDGRAGLDALRLVLAVRNCVSW